MPPYTLYSFYRSSCSARVRILLHLKNIAFDLVPINIDNKEQLSHEHRALNPSASVPLLVSQSTGLRIGQSLAAMEYLEEVHPETPTLPPAGDVEARAVVRVLCGIIVADAQPVTNLRITDRVKTLGGDPRQWNNELMTQGLKAYEDVIKGSAGRYSVGEQVTMADVCLVPAAWNAQLFGVDVAQFPTVSRVFGNLSELPAVQRAEYFRQPDCPADQRRE